MASHGDGKPHQTLQFRLCHILGLVRLHDYAGAHELCSAFGNFDDRYNTYEHYRKLYPSLRGSMIPFTLRLVRAALPVLLDKHAPLDALFELIEWIKHQYAAAQRASPPPPADASDSDDADAPPADIDALRLDVASLRAIDAAATAAADQGQPLTDEQTPPLRWRARLRRTRFVAAALLARAGHAVLAAAMLERELSASQSDDDDVAIFCALTELYVLIGDVDEVCK